MTFCNRFKVNLFHLQNNFICLLSVYPVCLQQHVDHPRGSMAPVHQQVSVIPDAGRVVSRGEFETTDVVDAGLHQPVHMLLHTHEAWL